MKQIAHVDMEAFFPYVVILLAPSAVEGSEAKDLLVRSLVL